MFGNLGYRIAHNTPAAPASLGVGVFSALACSYLTKESMDLALVAHLATLKAREQQITQLETLAAPVALWEVPGAFRNRDLIWLLLSTCCGPYSWLQC